ncbi:MAG: septum formation initiator family protein [Pseudomonadota bacterium]
MRTTPVRRRKTGFMALAVGALGLAYFGYHAVYGAHGLDERERLLSLEQSLISERDTLAGERDLYIRKVDLLRSTQLDPDLLDERARFLLGFVAEDEVILDLPRSR